MTQHRGRSEVRIDQSKMVESSSPSFSLLSRLLHAVYGVLLAVILVQAFLFLFRSGSVIIYFSSLWFMLLMSISAVLGWTFGPNLISWLKDEISNWWPF